VAQAPGSQLVVIDAGQVGAAAGGRARRPPADPGIEHLAGVAAPAWRWRPGAHLVVIDAGQVGAAAGGRARRPPADPGIEQLAGGPGPAWRRRQALSWW